ncbi:MAG: Gfo/Idh/MocA family oxidoreductase [Desulfobacterales bacterium]|jgi:predicted dehydrogenase|nr:Gfo/Idh/MocA family oxidoreductase [Desulfobacterales bacterium]
MKKLRVGVIGVGYLGKFHAEKYAQMDNVDLVGIVDVNREQAHQVAQQVGTRAYRNYEDLFGKVDAVSVVTPTPAHFEVSRAFLERDVDVLIEKPITVTLDEADALIDFAESRGLIIQVGHLERFNPAVMALQDIVKVPRFIESHRLSIFKPRGIDVSVVLDLMIHDIDIILNFVKSDVTDIRAAGTTVITDEVDIANARLEFQNGCVANVTASRISAKNERKIRLFQRDAYISVDFANQGITIIRQDDNGGEGIIPGMAMQQLSFAKADALAAEISAFVSCVLTRTVPEVSGKVGRDALKIVLHIMDQIQLTHQRF